jgi:ParB family transcriptional regulator, chromosome partitioning protein
MNRRKSFGLSQELERGISETINTTKNNVGQLRYEVIPLSRITLDSNNPRELSISLEDIRNGISEEEKKLLNDKQGEDLEKLQSLAESIKKVGVRHAIEVYKDGSNYKIISGERRFLASYLAKKTDIQARILEHKPSELDLKLLQWIENIERADLSLWERVNNVMQLTNSYENQYKEKVTAQKLGDILGCSRQHSTKLLAIVHADDIVLKALKSNKLGNLDKTAFIARTEKVELREILLNACINGASLENLQKISCFQENKKLNKHIEKKKKSAVYINLGHTNNIFSVKLLMESVLGTEKYSKYAEQFVNIDWSKLSAVNNAFKLFLKIVDKNEIGK